MAQPNGGNLILELSAHQASILAYVVRRAQEDPDFFDALVGHSGHHETLRLRTTLALVRKKLDTLAGRI